jgi:hypothetical protein
MASVIALFLALSGCAVSIAARIQSSVEGGRFEGPIEGFAQPM